MQHTSNATKGKGFLKGILWKTSKTFVKNAFSVIIEWRFTFWPHVYSKMPRNHYIPINGQRYIIDELFPTHTSYIYHQFCTHLMETQSLYEVLVCTNLDTHSWNKFCSTNHDFNILWVGSSCSGYGDVKVWLASSTLSVGNCQTSCSAHRN